MYISDRRGGLVLKLHSKLNPSSPYAIIDFVRRTPYRHNETRWILAYERDAHYWRSISDAAKQTSQHL